MKLVVNTTRIGLALTAVFVLGLSGVNRGVQAADVQPAANGAQQESTTIEPYTGEPIYLDEPQQIAKPTIVTRDTLKEKFDDNTTLRVEREIARYSDNTFAADGKYVEYHPNGKTFIEGQYKGGRHEGDWTYYFENGQVNRKVSYQNGKLSGNWEVHRADGTLAAKHGFRDGLRDGDWVVYDATGKQPLTEEHYAIGKEEGAWKTWFANGKQKQQASFKLGKRDGTSIEWNEKGEKQIEANYKNGKLDGAATRYLANGKSITQIYKDGRFVSETKQ